MAQGLARAQGNSVSAYVCVCVCVWGGGGGRYKAQGIWCERGL